MYCSDAPVFGTRTWGGLVGMAGGPPLMDGGFVGAPSSGIYNPLSGEWEVENIGVPPDIEVEQDPALVRPSLSWMVRRSPPGVCRVAGWCSSRSAPSRPRSWLTWTVRPLTLSVF